MNHIQISIEGGEEGQEILISLLSELGAVGFEQTETHLVAYFEEDNFLSYEVNEVIKGHPHVTTTVGEKNWNEEWERNFQPVVVDDFCAVRAHFHEPIASVEYEIIITPKMSFGTGHHATTYMMMQQMRALDLKDKAVFDFGTGTGVLAILAEKLGAASVYAIDNDEWSIENGLENARNNGCRNVTIELSSSIPSGRSFEVILANINRNVILQYLPQLRNAVVEGGRILFSGLLTTDEDIIVEACKKEGLQLVKREERSNWISLLMVKTVQ